jgi:hypothetical protein
MAPEFCDFTKYVLIEDGYSERVDPFLYLPSDSLVEGQAPADSLMKAKGIVMYTDYMRGISGA